jgi:hypothetical protein
MKKKVLFCSHDICIKPCLNAILSFLLQTYSNFEAITLDDLESHRLDEIFDFLVEESELNQKKILQSLYEIVNSRLVFLFVLNYLTSRSDNKIVGKNLIVFNIQQIQRKGSYCRK